MFHAINIRGRLQPVRLDGEQGEHVACMVIGFLQRNGMIPLRREVVAASDLQEVDAEFFAELCLQATRPAESSTPTEASE